MNLAVDKMKNWIENILKQSIDSVELNNNHKLDYLDNPLSLLVQLEEIDYLTKNKNLNEQINDFKLNEQKLNSEIEEKNKEINELKKKLIELNEKIKEFSLEKDDLEKKIENENKKIKELEDKNKELNERTNLVQDFKLHMTNLENLNVRIFINLI